jgi:hypothetical protein
VFRFESLEIRNAPSHFGAVAHAAIALHNIKPAVHVRHLDSERNQKVETTEKNSAADTSQDTNSTDSTSRDPGSNDPSGVDSKDR